MPDLTHWKLRGPVKSVRVEDADGDLPASARAPRRFRQFVVFDESGRVIQLDQRGGGDSVHRTRFRYDANGRPLSEESGTADGPIEFSRTWQYDDRGRVVLMSGRNAAGDETLREDSTYDEQGRQTRRATFHYAQRIDAYAVEGSEFGYGAPGAVAQVTRYDEAGRPIDSEFLDSADGVVRRVTMTHDGKGAVTLEEAYTPAALMFPRQPGMSDDDVRQLEALLAATASDSMRTTYEYDEQGRVTTRVHEWGVLGGERKTYVHDEHGNAIAEVTTSVRREIGAGDDGAVQTTNETTQSREMRFAYVYDAYGNWTERMASARITESGDFAPHRVEWRTIEYYAQP